MTTLKEHIDHVKNSTLYSNYNTGQAIDPSRARQDEKIKYAKLSNKLDYNSSNFTAEQTSPQSNYGRLK